MAASVDKKGAVTHLNIEQFVVSIQLEQSIEQLLPRLTAKCFEKDLISEIERNSMKLSSDGSTLLLNSILSKIELDHKWYR